MYLSKNEEIRYRANCVVQQVGGHEWLCWIFTSFGLNYRKIQQEINLMMLSVTDRAITIRITEVTIKMTLLVFSESSGSGVLNFLVGFTMIGMRPELPSD